MTGCVAVVSLAMGGPRASWAEERSHGGSGRGAWQASRFGLAETLQRLEASAHEHGLGVLIRWTPGDAAAAQELPVSRTEAVHASDGAVLVFASLAHGGTPVVMNGDAAPDLPLSLCVRSRADGGVEVLLPPDLTSYHGALPPELTSELTELPALVAAALG